MSVTRTGLFGLAFLGSMVAGLAHAQAPAALRFEGELADPAGNPLQATVPVTFAIYDGADSSATLAWSSTQDVEVVDGHFAVSVDVDSTAFLGDGERWLGIQVGQDPEMTPRFRFIATPYAVRASWADNALSDEEIKLVLADDPRFPSLDAQCTEGQSVAASASGWTCVDVVGTAGPQGPQGEVGPAGPQGETGPQGPAGTDGAPGPAGADGAMGPAGADGAMGPAGPVGPPGADGAGVTVSTLAFGSLVCPEGGVLVTDASGAAHGVCTGAPGPQGADGVMGPAGPTGPAGAQGPAGNDGASVAVTALPFGSTSCPEGGVEILDPTGASHFVCTGLPGPTGPQGPTGADGAVGPQGPAGMDGHSVSVASLPFGSVQCPEGGIEVLDPTGATHFICTGAPGPTGADGAVGPQGPAGADGSVGPQGPAGADGQSVSVASLPFGSTQCPEGGIEVLDPTGATHFICTGAPGPTGADGAVGPQGPAGADGAMGPAGPQGPAGADGAMGPAGPQGPAGADGAMGPQGPAGADGAMGPAGPQGPAGAVGAMGPQGPAGVDGAVGPMGPQGPAAPSVSIEPLAPGAVASCAGGGLIVRTGTAVDYVCMDDPSAGAAGPVGAAPFGSGSAGDLVVAAGTTVDVVSSGWSALPGGMDLDFGTIDVAGTLRLPSGLTLRATSTVSVSGTIEVHPGAAHGHPGHSLGGPSVGPIGSETWERPSIEAVLEPDFEAGGSGYGDGGGRGGGGLAIHSGARIFVSGTIRADGDAGLNPSHTGVGLPGPGGGAGGYLVLLGEHGVEVSGTLSARGGSGASGFDGDGGAPEGGGGGGGGGVVHLIAPAAPTVTGSIDVSSGAAGSTVGAAGTPNSGFAGGAAGGAGGYGGHLDTAGSSSAISPSAGASGLDLRSAVNPPSRLLE